MNQAQLRSYLSTPEVSELIFMEPPNIRTALIEGRFPPPDILLGNKKGWEAQRIRDFGIWAGHIDNNGARLTPARGRKWDVKRYEPDMWSVSTEMFYSLLGIAKLAGTYRQAITELHWHQFLPAPDVRLGDMLGWSEAKADEIARKWDEGGAQAFVRSQL